MYQPKVSTIQKYSDSQGEHVVCEGELTLLNGSTNNHRIKIDINGDACFRYYNPIIISENEEIEVGDKVYYAGEIIIWSQADEDGWNKKKLRPYKILAFPEHFSNKHLQAIIDGKMKDGDEVLIKCRNRSTKTDRNLIGHTPAGEPTYVGNYDVWNEVDLGQQNHITLFPVKQSLEEVADIWSTNIDNVHPADSYIAKQGFIAGAEWAKENGY